MRFWFDLCENSYPRKRAFTRTPPVGPPDPRQPETLRFTNSKPKQGTVTAENPVC